MANVKRIKITGELPFNCDDSEEMQKILLQTNTPTFGLRFHWGNIVRFVEHDSGSTAMVSYVFCGEEAVRYEWFDKLVKVIESCGGTVNVVEKRDIEAEASEAGGILKRE